MGKKDRSTPFIVPPYVIVGFNLKLENFNEVPLPDIEVSNIPDVAVLGGCLCMNVYKTTQIDVWVMKEYGNRDSWIKLLTLVHRINSDWLWLRPLCYSNDGSKVLVNGNLRTIGKLFWYDLSSGQITNVEGIPYFYNAVFCVGSLVSPFFPLYEGESSKSII